jgi:hypothetical protein
MRAGGRVAQHPPATHRRLGLQVLDRLENSRRLQKKQSMTPPPAAHKKGAASSERKKVRLTLAQLTLN